MGIHQSQEITPQGGRQFSGQTGNSASSSATSMLIKQSCKKIIVCFSFSVFFILSACGGSDGGPVQDQDQVQVQDQVEDQITDEVIDPDQIEFETLGLQIVSDDEWDSNAVRQVLDIFAFGGQAYDAQIETWANMRAELAITEMLTFDQHNLLLSPPAESDNDMLSMRDGTLRGLGEFWSSDDKQNGVPEERRYKYDPEDGVTDIWVTAAISRGLNPFRQKIGLWETNYHLATSLDTNVWTNMMIRYYDDIMEAHASSLPYQDILSIASTSAAVARQYGHWANKIVDGECLCNEDFAREYYQLFYGIFGDFDTDYHETITIKNTAFALTGIGLEHILTGNGGLGDGLIFTTEDHYQGELEMMNLLYLGETADDRINQMSQDAINHQESLNNLPVMIISGLADDNLDEYKIESLRNAWANMQTKNLLTFIRAYAVSTLFHNPDRVKYLSSIDRQIKIGNSMILNNEEVYLNLYNVGSFENEGVQVFHPIHNNFGGQTGVEAFNSAGVFRNNYNSVTATGAFYRIAEDVKFGRTWEKDWGAVMPVNQAGGYLVKDVAEWLWVRFVGDSLRNFGPLERAYTYAFLASDSDLVNLVSPGQLDRVITAMDVQTDPDILTLVENLAGMSLMLGSIDKEEFRIANEHVGQAINFIIGTPYIFVQEGGKI